MATSEPLNLRKLGSETRKIINAQPRNFFTLSFLFLVPPTIAVLLYPTDGSFLPDTDNNQPVNGTPTKTLSPFLPVYVLNLSFYLCAVGSITYATFHGFSGETIKLKSAIKSISSSFFPLLATTLITKIIVVTIALILSFFATFGFLLVSGFRIELFSSPYFVGFIIALMVVMVLVVLYLQVNWGLAPVVVVVESTWGFEALKRSKTLIKGKRGLALSLYLIFGFVYGVYGWSSYYISGGADDRRRLSLLSTLQFLFNSGFLSLVQLYNMTATTVLYCYCKVNHDRQEFSGYQCVSLLVDHDEKDVNVV